MKIAILSDIHGNLPAFEAVHDDSQRWGADITIINGDIVNRGPNSIDCWLFAKELRSDHGWLLNRGNHEGYVTNYLIPNHKRKDPSFWTYVQLGKETEQLQTLSDSIQLLGPDNSEVRVRHGSMQGWRDGLFEDSPVDRLRNQIAPAPAVYVTSHTHFAFLRTLDQGLIVNTGSTGQPADKDSRASYAQIWWQNGAWQATNRRVDYDREQVEQEFKMSGFLQANGPMAWLFYYEWLFADTIVLPWIAQYQDAVRSGKIEFGESVGRFLESIGQSRPYFPIVREMP